MNAGAQLGSSVLPFYSLGTCPMDGTTHIQDGSCSPQLNLSGNALKDVCLQVALNALTGNND